MSIADTNHLSLLVKAETAFGEVVAAPVAGMQAFLVKSESLAHKNEVVMSETILPDATRNDQLVVGYSAGGTLSAELVYGACDAFLAAACRGAWTANVLYNGALNSSFLIEKAFLDVGRFFAFTGCSVESLKISATRKQIVQVEIVLLSKEGMVLTTVTIADANPLAAVAGTSLTASANFAGLTVNGAPISERIGMVELTIKNSLRARDGVGVMTSAEFGRGYLEVSGQIEVYFSSVALYTAAVNNDALALAFSLGGSANKRYDFSLPKIKLTPDTPNAGGANQDVMLKLPFNAFRDSASGHLIGITRVP